MWKLGTGLKEEDIKNAFKLKKDDIKDFEQCFEIDDLHYLEHVQDIELGELELADTDICLIEISHETSPFLFKVKKIEMKEENCDWCRSRKLCRYFCICKEVWYCSEMCKMKDSNYHEGRCQKKLDQQREAINNPNERSKKGLVGLQNLGNTCFMNTALQCIMNCYELSQYFLKGTYKEHINLDNPIGTKGVLARAYTNLLKNIYNGTSDTFSPWDFKQAISGFQTMFMGYQQHDTQEFLNYLLDGLHEDLNKVKKKPLVEKDDSPKEDKEKSLEQWIGFLRRNQSLLVDLLYGQYKSTLHCPNTDCNNISVTFDPFLSLTLPIIQNANAYDVTCLFVPFSTRSKTININLRFNSEYPIMAMRNKLGKILNIHPWSFFIVKTTTEVMIDQICNSRMLIKNTSPTSRMGIMGMSMYRDSEKENTTMFVCYQINPKFFYSKNNKYCLDEEKVKNFNKGSFGLKQDIEARSEVVKKIYAEDYEEEIHGMSDDSLSYYSKRQTQTYSGDVHVEFQKINTDDNMGFDNNWIKIILWINQYEYSMVGKRKKIILQRMVYMHKSWTTKKIHLEIFKHFFKIIVEKNKLNVPEYNENNEDLEVDYQNYFNKFFGEDYCPQSENDSYEFHEKKSYPYRLRIRSIVNEAKNATCYHCKSRTCHDCLLPYSDEITLGKLCSEVPKNITKEKEEYEIDNNFYYLNLSQQNRIVNKDIMIELTWLSDYKSTVYTILNDITEVDIKVQKQKKINNVTLDDCFKNFMKYEKLEPENEWYCPSCKNHVRATKKMEIYKAPPILILHLKRFANNNKLSIFVDYPVKDLDLTEYIKEQSNISKLYDLFAVSNHYGGMGGGHYVAYAQNYFNKKWYKFDDSHVAEMEESSVVKESGYVLFYRRKDVGNLDLEQLYNKQFENYEDSVKKQEKKEEVILNIGEDSKKSLEDDEKMNIDDERKS